MRGFDPGKCIPRVNFKTSLREFGYFAESLIPFAFRPRSRGAIRSVALGFTLLSGASAGTEDFGRVVTARASAFVANTSA